MVWLESNLIRGALTVIRMITTRVKHEAQREKKAAERLAIIPMVHIEEKEKKAAERLAIIPIANIESTRRRMLLKKSSN